MASKIVSIEFLAGHAPDDLIRAFSTLVEKTRKKITRKAMKAAAKEMLPTIISLTPIDFESERDGKHLVNTIKVKAIRRSRTGVGSIIQTGTRTELGIDANDQGYFPFSVEYGTEHAPAQSYLRAGFAIKKEASLKAAAAVVKTEYDKVWRTA